MAGKTQLNLSINPQVSKQAASTFSKQFAETFAKVLTPAITKAIEDGFKAAGSSGAVKRAAAKSAEQIAEAEAKAREKAMRQAHVKAERQHKQQLAEQRKSSIALEKEKASIEKATAQDIAKFERAEQKKSAQQAAAAQKEKQRQIAHADRRSYEEAVAPSVRARDYERARKQLPMTDEARADAKAEEHRKAFNSAQRQREAERKQAAKEKHDQMDAMWKAYSPTAAQVRAETREQIRQYEESTPGAPAAAGRAVRGASLQGRQRRDMRMLATAERQIARLRGDESYEVQRLEGAARRLGASTNLPQRLAHERRMASLFPGAGRFSQATGMPLGAVRFGMGAAGFVGGVASGNPLAGAAGGGYAGMAAAGALGLGGAAAGLLTGGLAGVGAVGALGVLGMKTGYDQAGRALAFQRSLAPLSNVAPTRIGSVGATQQALKGIAYSGSRFGYSPEQALQIMGTSNQAAGYWAGSSGAFETQRRAMELQAAYGVGAQTTGGLEFARRRGGISGLANMRAGALPLAVTQQAVGLGFQGSEIATYAQQIEQMAAQARGMGTSFNLGNFGQAVGALAPRMGQFAANRLVAGGQASLQQLTTGGLGASGNTGMDLLRLQAFGGLQIGRGHRLGAKELWQASQRAEQGGVTAEGIQRLIGMSGRLAGGNQYLQRTMLQSMLGQMGMSAGPEQIEALMGRPSADVIAQITKGGGAEAAAAAATGVGARGQAMAPPEAKRAAEIEGRMIRVGEAWIKSMNNVNSALQTLADNVKGASRALEVLSGFTQ